MMMIRIDGRSALSSAISLIPSMSRRRALTNATGRAQSATAEIALRPVPRMSRRSRGCERSLQRPAHAWSSSTTGMDSGAGGVGSGGGSGRLDSGRATPSSKRQEPDHEDRSFRDVRTSTRPPCWRTME